MTATPRQTRQRAARQAPPEGHAAPGGASRPVPAIELRGITKRFGPVVACDGVDLAIHRGEIHGLLGENGAGKSTLMKVLSGLLPPDAGAILRDGRPVDMADPQAAARLGVGMVHQHFSLIEPLTVWENIVLGGAADAPGADGGRGGLRGLLRRMDPRAARARREWACAAVERVGARYGIPVDPLARVEALSAGQRQRVEIIKCLIRDPDVLILDEPTSVLSLAESRELFEILRRAVVGNGTGAGVGADASDDAGDDASDDAGADAAGPGAAKAVVLISHRLPEILAATDQVTVLRRGRVVARRVTAETSAAELARQMVGREVALGAAVGAVGGMGTATAAVSPAAAAAGSDSAPASTPGARAGAGVPASDLPEAGAIPAAARPGGTIPPGGIPADATPAGIGAVPAPGAAPTRIPAQREAAPASPPPDSSPSPDSPAALELSGIVVRAATGVPLLSGLDLTVRPGEIVGLYGVEGNGQHTLGDLLSGLVVPAAGTIRIAGRPVDPRRPGALRAAGLGIIPEDRHRSGCVLDMSVADNLVLTDLSPVSGRIWVDRRRRRRHAAELVERFGIRAPSLDMPLRHLSGGNQQRVVLARELAADPAVLVAAQPTRGLDVGAIEDMHAALRAAAARGVGVLLVSTELEEVIALSTRIAVISAGRIVGVLSPHQADPERLGLLVGAATAGSAAP